MVLWKRHIVRLIKKRDVLLTKSFIWRLMKRTNIFVPRPMNRLMKTVISWVNVLRHVIWMKFCLCLRIRLTIWTFLRNRLYLLLRRWYRSWKTTMRTAHWWVLICSVRLCRFYVRSRLLLVLVWNIRSPLTLAYAYLLNVRVLLSVLLAMKSVYVRKMAVLMFMNF